MPCEEVYELYIDSFTSRTTDGAPCGGGQQGLGRQDYTRRGGYLAAQEWAPHLP